MAGEGRPLTKMEALRDLVNGNRLDLNHLNTSNKSSIVEAVNEIVSGVGAIISDAITSTWTTWSSSKILTELDKKATSSNPTFTGTVNIPNGSLSIAKTLGLQTALDAYSLSLRSKNVTDTPSSYPDGYSIGLFHILDGWPNLGTDFRSVVTYKVPTFPIGTTQHAYPYGPGTAPVLRRIATTATAWGSWEIIDGQDTSNVASGTGSTVSGGINNQALGYYSTAAGRGSIAASQGMRSYGAPFSTPGDAQDASVIVKAETTSAVALMLRTDGNDYLIVPENTTWAIRGLLVGRRVGVLGEHIAAEFTALVKRDAGSTGGFIGTPTITEIGKNAGNTWSISISALTNGRIYVYCTGETGKTIRWLATVTIAHVSS